MAEVPEVPLTFDNACVDHPNFIYVLEAYRIKPAFMADPIAVADNYSVAVQISCGWKRVVLLDSITGPTAAFVQLYRIPAPGPAADPNPALQANAEYTAFFDQVLGFSRVFLCPLPYDPSRANGGDPDAPIRALVKALDTSFDTPENVLLIDRFGVASGHLPELIAAKEQFFIPKVVSLGWQLVAAGTEMMGKPDQVIQIWTLPDSNRLLKTMRAMTQSLQYRTRIIPLLTSEQQELFEPRAR
jgi:hypothetical protein